MGEKKRTKESVDRKTAESRQGSMSQISEQSPTPVPKENIASDHPLSNETQEIRAEQTKEEPKQAVRHDMRESKRTIKTSEKHAAIPEVSADDSKAEPLIYARPADTIRETTIQDEVSDRSTGESFRGFQAGQNGAHAIQSQKGATESAGARHMPRASMIQQTAKQTEGVSFKIREQIDEQPDVSPSEYAEQKVEQYSSAIVHRTESAADKMGDQLRRRTVQYFREKREQDRQVDAEVSEIEAETETAEANRTTERVSESYSYPEAAQPEEAAPEHLTYRDRPERNQHTELAERKRSASSSMEQRGGKNHAQRQTVRSDWEKNASGHYGTGTASYHSTDSVYAANGHTVSPAQNLASGTEKEAHSAAQTANHAVKTTQQAVKTTEQAAKTTQKTVKTTQQTAKTAQKSAQASAKAARMAREAAVKTGQAVAKAAQAAGKGIAAAVKAIITALEELIAAIAAGGWVSVIVIAVIAVIALILSLCFGVFYSNDVSEGRPMTAAISEINADFVDSINARINRYKRQYKPDEMELVYEGDTDSGGSVMNWADVLGIYAVSTTTDPDQPTDVLIVTPEKVEILRSIFQRMNSVSYHTEIETEEIPSVDDDGTPLIDEEGNPVTETRTKLTITIRVSSMDYREAAALYNFNDNQNEMLREIMKPEYYPLYARLTGDVIGDGGEFGFGLDINPDLPPSELGYQIVQAAKRYIGRSYASMDCSTLARTAYKDCGLTSMNGLSSVRMAQKCQEMGCLFTDPSQLQAGDLIFFSRFDPSRGKDYCGDIGRCGTGKCRRWLHIHHVAIYINEEFLIDSTGGDNSVQIRRHWGMDTAKWKWVCFGRPTT